MFICSELLKLIDDGRQKIGIPVGLIRWSGSHWLERIILSNLVPKFK